MALRTAEEILDEHLKSLAWDGFNPELIAMEARAKDAIRAAMKEAIEECAEKAEAYANSNTTDYKGRTTGIVDKESILLLIKKLK